MENVIHALACLANGIQVEEIGLAKINFAENFCDVFALAGRKIINSTN